jgi:hypothetical protein
MPTRSPLTWLRSYFQELSTHRLEQGWQADLFRPYILLKGLRYPSALVHSWPDRSDIRIVTPEGLPYMVIECKRADAELNTEDTWKQVFGDPQERKPGYLQGGEAFVVLASPRRLRVFSPDKKPLGEVILTDAGPSEPELWRRLSYDFMQEKKHLEDFRAGRAPYAYIPVHTEDGFKRFLEALRRCHNILKRYVVRAWQGLRGQYAEYRQKLGELERTYAERESVLAPPERDDFRRQVEEEKGRLAHHYRNAIEAVERHFAAFQRTQPYSRPPEDGEGGQALEKVYLTDVVYAALNRILLVRIAEDKGLVGRKISNGGLKVWREFVSHIKDRYQELLRIAYLDTGQLYPHFFERGIFDWYMDSDQDLHEALELVFYQLNAYDFSEVDRDLLGTLYQEYLEPRERKKLGEFYTPREVVDYILRHVGWPHLPGDLLDPACGSGSFLARAAHFLLQDMERRGMSEEARLQALERIVGLDINPFATHIAEMNLLFLFLDLYLRAKEEARRQGRELLFPRIPVYCLDSLLGGSPQGGSMFLHGLRLEPLEEGSQRRDRLGHYRFVVMNPPYVRNERVPEDARVEYQKLFNDVAYANADLYTYFLKKGMDWLQDGGRLGVIVSYGVADSDANGRLRRLLARHAIERIVPLEWAPDVFVSHVNTFILIVRKERPGPDHKLTLVHGIRSVKDLDGEGGVETQVDQARWLALAPDGSWRLEVSQEDLPILEKMKAEPCFLTAGYGMTKRSKAKGREIISSDPKNFSKPYPVLDGREIKAWSIEWQGRWIDYDPALIDDPKTLEFFQPPKVLARRISLTTQAAVDEGVQGQQFLAMDTVMVVRSSEPRLAARPYLIAALLNSLPIRYYAFLMLRTGVVQQGWSTFYPRVFGAMPTPLKAVDDEGLAKRLEGLSYRAHEIAREMARGDRQVLTQVKGLAKEAMPFAQHPRSDIRGWVIDLDVATAQVSEEGELRCENLTLVKGDPAVLNYILAVASLEGKERLTRQDFETFRIPSDAQALEEALRLLGEWQGRKPSLAQELAGLQQEIDDLVLDAFTSLTPMERATIRRRVTEFPLSEVLRADLPGAPTRQIPVRYFRAGQRYR